MSIEEILNDIKDELIGVRRHIHRNPELSFQEYRTTSYIGKILTKYGIEYKKFDNNPGLMALIKGENAGKTIGLRADIDALPISENTGLEYSSNNPGVMHACGHDLHTTILIGCAIILNQFKKEMYGNIKLIFQPAEETQEGAKAIIDEDVLLEPEVDALVALHTWPELPTGTIGIKKGAMTAASDYINISVEGKSGHAAHPETSVDPIILASYILTSLQTIVSRELPPLEGAVLTIGHISGGDAPNIIPEKVNLSGMIRTLNNETRNKMINSIERIATNIAKGFGGDAKVDYKRASPSVINDESLTEILIRSAEKSLGKEKVVILENPSLGSEDFAYFLQDKPGVFFRLGTSNDNADTKRPLHDAKIKFDEEAMYTGIQVVCETALDLLGK